MIKNTGEGQNGIGSNGKVKEKDKFWRQLKRKKKSSKRNQKLGNEQKMMRRKWATQLTLITMMGIKGNLSQYKGDNK